MNYTSKQYVIFDNDDDFLKYAVNPEPVIKALGTSGANYFTFDYSNVYKDDCAKKLKFLMRDDNSYIMKRGVVSYRSISLPVEVSSLNHAILIGDISEDDIIKK